jgi:four helix bundle protein
MKHNFRDLGIWKDSFAIVKDVYDLCIKLPSEEKYGLKSQIQRCAISIPSNIAEGSGRSSDKEFLLHMNWKHNYYYVMKSSLLK